MLVRNAWTSTFAVFSISSLFRGFQDQGLPANRLEQESAHVAFLIRLANNAEQNTVPFPRLRALPIGRRQTLAAITPMAPVTAEPYIPYPARVPSAAEHHSVAAVLSPVIFRPSRRITLAPKNPIPETICPAMRKLSSGPERRKHDEHRSARSDERVRSQAGHALPPLAFRADQRAENQSEQQPDRKVMPKHGQ